MTQRNKFPFSRWSHTCASHIQINATCSKLIEFPLPYELINPTIEHTNNNKYARNLFQYMRRQKNRKNSLLFIVKLVAYSNLVNILSKQNDLVELNLAVCVVQSH